MRAGSDLQTLERWMQAVVMHPEGADSGLVAPGPGAGPGGGFGA